MKTMGEIYSMMRLFMVALLLCLPLQLTGTDLSNSLDTGLDEGMIFLHVDKKLLKAELRTWPQNHQDSESLLTLRIAIGKAEGDKQVEGDNKTPEGIYFAQNLIDGKTLPAKYGPFAVPINFPNHVDKSLGKTGYGIWLHGVEKDARVEEAKVTEGCVAFYNADIEALAKWLKPQQTVVLISDGWDTVNRTEDIAEVKRLSEAWMNAWADRQLDSYISHYSDKFQSKGMNRDAYGDYKRRVFAAYNKMDVDFTDTRVFTHENYALVVTNQDFNGDNRYKSQGRKLIYWGKENGQWKITHEIFENRRYAPQRYSRELMAKLYKSSPSAKVFSKQLRESNL